MGSSGLDLDQRALLHGAQNSALSFRPATRMHAERAAFSSGCRERENFPRKNAFCLRWPGEALRPSTVTLQVRYGPPRTHAAQQRLARTIFPRIALLS